MCCIRTRERDEPKAKRPGIMIDGVSLVHQSNGLLLSVRVDLFELS